MDKVSSDGNNLEENESNTVADEGESAPSFFNNNKPSEDKKAEGQLNTLKIKKDKPDALEQSSDKQHPEHEEHVESDDKSNFNNLLIKHKPGDAVDPSE